MYDERRISNKKAFYSSLLATSVIKLIRLKVFNCVYQRGVDGFCRVAKRYVSSLQLLLRFIKYDLFFCMFNL